MIYLDEYSKWYLNHVVHRRAREAHYAKHFGPTDGFVAHSKDVKPVHIDIYTHPPNEKRAWSTLVTSGMSDQPQPVPAGMGPGNLRTEIIMYTSQPASWMPRLLKLLAEYPFLSGRFLDWGHVYAALDLMEGLGSSGVMFLRPSFEEPSLGELRIGGDSVRFLWAVLVTESECQYAMRHGGRALQSVFEKAGVKRLLGRDRRPVV